ncbi:MAG: UDP-3-O-acyl-N-acetylglucosamine deacetylase [Alphaproteobacteria bacterium]
MPHDAMHQGLTSTTKLPKEAVIGGAARPSMQRTLFGVTTCSGIGVHSGEQVTLKLMPAPENTGIVFIRSDLTGDARMVPARWDNVTDTRLCTIIANGRGGEVATIEHLMAALHACGIDNAFIEISGREVPVMDGSSNPFVFLIDVAGSVEQSEPRRMIEVLKPVEVKRDGKYARLEPADDQSFSLDIDFNQGAIGQQKYDFTLTPESFKAEISRARTFGMRQEVDELRKHGLALGGSLDNSVVIDGDKVMNPEGLRYQDEPVRHKLLDAVGDLALAGSPIRGRFVGSRSGHAINNELLRALFADPTAWRLIESAELAEPLVENLAS